MQMVGEWNCEHFVVAEIPCEWKLETKFPSDCECDGLVHSDSKRVMLSSTGNIFGSSFDADQLA